MLAVCVLALAAGSARAASLSAEDGKSLLEAQALYQQVVREGLGGPYIAPLHDDPDGPRYLWGGLDPIEALNRYNRRRPSDIGGVVFISRQGTEIGKPEFAVDVPLFPGGPTMPALFVSEQNRARFVKETAEGTFMVMLGMNCMWGAAAGPATEDGPRPLHSHWAQPGLASISPETFSDPESGQEVTALGVVFYLRGDDWNAIRPNGWRMQSTALRALLDQKEPWNRRRPNVPIVRLFP